jgi:hypothetical protein
MPTKNIILLEDETEDKILVRVLEESIRYINVTI